MAEEMQPSEQNEEQNENQSSEESKEREESDRMCKFCFGGEHDEDDIPRGPLLRVCPCNGSQRYVHHNCIVQWFEEKGDRCCPICRTKVKVTEKLKPMSEWRLPPLSVSKRQMLETIVDLFVSYHFIKWLYAFVYSLLTRGWPGVYAVAIMFMDVLLISPSFATMSRSVMRTTRILLTLNKVLVVRPFEEN